MIKLELSIAPTYVRWGIWEAIREIIQNAKDGDDLGYPMDISHDPQTNILTVNNAGIKLGRETLVLGTTTKRDDANQRGEFAEGYKLALATFANLGKQVKIINDNELWTPSLQFSKQFNTEVLTVTISSIPSQNKLSFIIHDISEDQWKLATSRLLFMNEDNGEALQANRGRLLKDPKHEGKLYVKGIFVDSLSDNYKYGYDLSGVKLDRDRNIPDNWTLQKEIKNTIKETTCKGFLKPKDIFEIFDTPCGEASIFTNDYEQASEFHEMLRVHFEEVYGSTAIPVESMGESMEAGHFGLKGIVVSNALAKTLGKVIDPFSKVKERKSMEIIKTYSAHELTMDEVNNFIWAVDLVSSVEDDVDTGQVSVVDFLGPNMCGIYNGTVKVAKKLLLIKSKLIATMVHEFAHRYGMDGTVQHRDACERMFGDIISGE